VAADLPELPDLPESARGAPRRSAPEAPSRSPARRGGGPRAHDAVSRRAYAAARGHCAGGGCRSGSLRGRARLTWGVAIPIEPQSAVLERARSSTSVFVCKRRSARAGLGAVWKATDLELDEIIAIKFLASQLVDEEALVASSRRFRCRASSTTQHHPALRHRDLRRSEVHHHGACSAAMIWARSCDKRRSISIGGWAC